KFLRAFRASELVRAIFSAADALLRHRRVELKGKPAHRYLAIERSNGFFESSLADVAPRTDYVGNHLDGERHFGSALCLNVRLIRSPTLSLVFGISCFQNSCIVPA